MTPLMYAKLGGAVAVIAGAAWLGYSYRDNACDADTQRARADAAEQAHANAQAEIKRLQGALQDADEAVAAHNRKMVELQHEHEAARRKLDAAKDASGCADSPVVDDILRLFKQSDPTERGNSEE